MAKVTLGLLGGLSGKAGNAVFVTTRRGAVLRSLPAPNNPRTPAQQAARYRMARCGELYRALTAAQLLRWRDYAATTATKDASGNPTNAPNAYNVFCGLSSKFLQVFPTGTPPQNPPAAPFFGDAITVTATATAGHIAFTADGANNPHVVTELLLQPLRNGARVPMPRDYRNKAFVTFAAGSLTATLTVPAGAYAPACRFVHALTGQETALLALPVVVA